MSFIRFRKQDSTGDFYDPEADFRKMLPAVLMAAAGTLAYPEAPVQDKQAISFIKNLCVFYRVRLLEDPSRIDRVFSDFDKAFQNVPVTMRYRFLMSFFRASAIAYGILCRREAANDPEIARAIGTVAKDIGLLSMLPSKHARQCIEDLSKVSEARVKDIMQEATKEAIGVEDANGVVVLADLKGFLMKQFTVIPEDATWDQLAGYLDKQVEALPAVKKHLHGVDMKEFVKLAYPMYDLECSELKKETSLWKKLKMVFKKFLP